MNRPEPPPPPPPPPTVTDPLLVNCLFLALVTEAVKDSVQ